jgi:hypothetical protein
MRSLGRPVFAALAAFVALAGACAHRDHVLGAAAPDAPSCKVTHDCPWGYECSGARCLESECHGEDPSGPLGTKSCTHGTCEFDDDEGAAHGNGACTEIPLSH